jgi:hypothetical protein
MLCREINAVSCENHVKHINALDAQNEGSNKIICSALGGGSTAVEYILYAVHCMTVIEPPVCDCTLWSSCCNDNIPLTLRSVNFV